jgi:two-component system sensor histidine kinase KdpD
VPASSRAEPAAASRRAADFLELIERSRRGKLKIYIGSAAGVGKTYRMLQEAQALRIKGVDIVLAFVETHGREETAALVTDLEVVPRKQISYRGVSLEEMDLDAVLARKPDVAVVDELAHTNAPGSRHEKRYEDVLELTRAGINVLTAVNIQHLESLNDLVSSMTGVPIRETVPDFVVRDADQVVNIDLSVEDLRDRLQAGKIYPPEKIQSALGNFFAAENLAALRELALREVAETAEREAQRSALGERSKAGARPVGKVMLCLSASPPHGAELVRRGSRIAGRLNTHWYVVFVERPSEDPARIDAAVQRQLADNIELARSLGAEVVKLHGRRVAELIVRFAEANSVRVLLLGRSHRPPWRHWLGGSLLMQLLRRARGIDIQILSTREEK